MPILSDTSNKILIFHVGSLGDTLIAMPCFRAIREHFKSAHISLLSNFQVGGFLVNPSDILGNENLVDSSLTYVTPEQLNGNLNKYSYIMNLRRQLRDAKYDTLVYLIRERQTRIAVLRDLAFFRLAGIRRFIGTRALIHGLQIKKPAQKIKHQVDFLLDRLASSGIPVPRKTQRNIYIANTDEEMKAVDEWVSQLPPSGNKRLIAIGPGGKQAVNIWPYDRYGELVERLIKQHDIWPIVFGGREDGPISEKLITKWKRGWAAAGSLSVRQSISLMKRCIVMIGNDTGSIHMAAAAGIRCIGIYSSRNPAGLWDPYGQGHVVFRTNIECEGCGLQKCIKNRMKCILAIDVDSVYKATERMLLNVGTEIYWEKCAE